MNRLQQWVLSSWTVPVISGVLILLSFGVGRLGGDAWNPVIGPQWWIDAGAHAHGSGDVFVLADLFMLAAAVVAGYGIVLKAVRALMIKVIGIDLLVAIAAIGAILIGNFWEAAAVTFLFAIGHALEAATMNKTRSALAELVAVAPDTAIVMREGAQVEVPAHLVRMGEIVLVKNGAKVPVDGHVVSGTGAIDEASITGESIPVEKGKCDQVFAGTVSRGGFLQVLATGIGADTTLARIIHRVEEAQDAKAGPRRSSTASPAWYTPAIIVLAVLAWLITRDVVLALTLLVIGCPGALVISIPVAIVAGIGRAARNGILIKGGEYLETSAKIYGGRRGQDRHPHPGPAAADRRGRPRPCAGPRRGAAAGPRPPRPAPSTRSPAHPGRRRRGRRRTEGTPSAVNPVPGKGIAVATRRTTGADRQPAAAGPVRRRRRRRRRPRGREARRGGQDPDDRGSRRPWSSA